MKHRTLCAALACLALPLVGHAAEPLRIAADATYPPFEYTDASGAVVGFDIDVTKAACAEMKTECVLVNQPWDGLIPGVQAHKYDAIVSMNISAERLKVVSFSQPFYYMYNSFVGHTGTKPDVSPTALKGKIIAVQRGSTQDRFITDTYGKTATVKRYINAQDPMMEMANGRADFTFGNTAQLKRGFLDTPKGQGFGFIGPTFDGRKDKVLGEGMAFVVRKDNTELANRFSQAIATLKQKGVIKQLAAKHNLTGLIGE